MTFWKSAALAMALSTTSTRAFVPHLTPSSPQTIMYLTSEEILARSRQAAGQPAQDSLPMVFDEDILADMQSALLTLEKRVQDGPGSLTKDEIDELTAQLNRIVDEMHQNPHRRHKKPVREEVQPPPAPQQQQAPPSVAAAPAAQVAAPPATPTPAQPRSTATSDESDDEGPAYDGSGGMGQPRGTVNTYIIEGMEEMTSEEYRLALQQSIIDKQRERRKAGNVGNRGSLDYLHSLSPGGTDSQRRGSVEPDERGPKGWNAW